MLRQKLNELFQKTAGGQGQPPVPTEVVIAEVDRNAFDSQGRATIEVGELQTPDEYAVRFAAIMAKAYPWVNLSFYGFIDGKGLVVVELPSVEPHHATPSTSVNFSGPPAVAAASGWDARSHVVLIVSATTC